jgi:4-diphosphocytidyl-2-C-methyl-D-erythritol kinase
VSPALVRVPAKINLCLGVGPRQADGFHSLATVYQAVDLCDEVHIRPRTDGEFTVKVVRDFDGTEGPQVPLGGDNIAVQAALLVRKALNDDTLGADIAIRKVIPVAGGMAGGSADAAAALLGANEAWGGELDRGQLDALARELGSDVPFLLRGGTAMGTGHGEIVSPVLARGTFHWVCVTQSYGLSTAAVYERFDALSPDAPEPSVPSALLTALAQGDPVALGAALDNDLTEAALSLHPGLESLMGYGQRLDALGTLLSGSGPTVLMLAESQEHALDIMAGVASLESAADTVHAIAPVPGARLI